VNEVFLEKHDGLLHWLNASNGVFSDHLDITEVLHDLHKSVFLRLSLTGFREVLNAFLDSLDEILDVGNLSGGVLEKELSVLLDPFVDSGMELLDELLAADLEPANVVVDFLAVNRVLHAVEELNLFVECMEVGCTSSNTVEDLLLKVRVAIHSITHVVIELLLVIVIVLNPALLDVEFLEVSSLAQEVLE